MTAAILGLGMLAGCTGQIGEHGAGASSDGTVGAGGSTGGATSMPGTLNLDGSPQYYRLVRLTNAQWAGAVQDVLKLSAPSGLEQGFQSPVVGTTDFSNATSYPRSPSGTVTETSAIPAARKP